MRWILATERLGEFKDSDIPDWKFFKCWFAKVDGKPIEGAFFRKDILKNTITFSYKGLFGSNEISESEFDRIEWLDEQDEGWVPVEKGLKLVAAERKRQIEVEGWDNLHDSDHDKMQLTGAAACYAANAINKKCGGPISRFQYNFPPELDFLVNDGDRGDRSLDKGGWKDGWPWGKEWDKREKHDVLRSLVIAAALIIAEIDGIVNPPTITSSPTT